jgi:hypothetical protein
MFMGHFYVQLEQLKTKESIEQWFNLVPKPLHLISEIPGSLTFTEKRKTKKIVAENRADLPTIKEFVKNCQSELSGN